VYRLGIYDSINGLPTNLLVDGGTVAADSGGDTSKAVTVNYAVTRPSILWVVAVTNSTGTNRRIGNVQVGVFPGTATDRQLFYRTSSHDPTTSLPSTFGGVTYAAATGFPRIFITIA
jgi:hypothetical protein